MTQSNTDIAYEYIRNKILEGHYPPGYSLLTEDLAKESGVSRTPVRDALRMLETDGLVIIRSRTGAKVRQISTAEYKNLCEFRQALEGFGAGLAAAHRSTNDLAIIKEHLEKMEELSKALAKSKKPLELLPKMARFDSLFHVAIMAASKNDLMHKESIRLHLIFRVVAGRQRQSLKVPPNEIVWRNRRLELQQEHVKVYQAIADCDVDAARYNMEQHILKISQSTLSVLEREENAKLQALV